MPYYQVLEAVCSECGIRTVARRLGTETERRVKCAHCGTKLVLKLKED